MKLTFFKASGLLGRNTIKQLIDQQFGNFGNQSVAEISIGEIIDQFTGPFEQAGLNITEFIDRIFNGNVYWALLEILIFVRNFTTVKYYY